ncbi:MAG: 3'-5' exonuclease [Nitrospira sp.]
MKLSEATFTIVDTETTGLDPKEDHVVQVGIVRKTFGLLGQGRYEITVKPPISIPPSASAIHHLTDKHVQTYEPLSYYKDEIQSQVDGCILAAHNAKFDSEFLPFLEGKWLCTKRMAQHLWMDQAEKFSNQYLRYWLGLEVNTGPAHTALADATVTMEILGEEIKEYLKQGRPDDIDLFIAFAESPIMYTKMSFGKHRVN